MGHPCKSKKSFFSKEHAEACAFPGLEIYLCPVCKNYHSSSQGKNQKNKARFDKFKRKKK